MKKKEWLWQDEVMEDTIKHMRSLMIKGCYENRKSDFVVYLEKLKKLSYGKKNHKKTRTKKDN